MPLFLTRLLARFAVLSSWLTPVVVIVFVFVTSWPLMALAEPADSELVQPAGYWWYFVVTAATVGYGDLYPKTGFGHVVGAYVIVGGIAALTTVFTKLTSVLERSRGRRMQGTNTVTASGHIVVLGYEPGRTERIVAQLLADGEHRVVLCAWDEVATHPMPAQDIDFVRGELTEEDVLRRAGVHRAEAVLIDARDDNEALSVAVGVDHLNTAAHIVVALRDMDRATLLHYVDVNIHCVPWHTPRMITEELTSPGIAEVYADLMTHGGANTYSVRLPDSLGEVPIERCQTELGRRHGALVLAVRDADGTLVVNPGWSSTVSAGAMLYYVSSHKLSVHEVVEALR
ncbi:NAD-binding protein [Allokutzneria sp. A3M-2-11 16]|uniref:potassium channel family protein n=1 Tax=Allokutzneria sp. A3M-2-11 16 TaxID=2962043 RepID=UPI0020B7EF99|nr:NAD-binding protein [Allokutzneria sp. A3M-2-11 16]MCP3804888.1 NAD-binding protein [Allokutzneria sp. A3M-2-11 16]